MFLLPLCHVCTEEEKQAPAVQKDNAPAASEKMKTGIQNIWKTADETIDWTDALAHSTPTDGLTGPRMWTFIHKNAQNGVSDYKSWGCGDAADINADVGKQWLAMYVNRSSAKGDPILADTLTLQKGSDKKPDNCNGCLRRLFQAAEFLLHAGLWSQQWVDSCFGL